MGGGSRDVGGFYKQICSNIESETRETWRGWSPEREVGACVVAEKIENSFDFLF